MRRISLASLVAVALVAAIPSGASAATQIGETFLPSAPCGSVFTWVQSGSPGGQYAAPTAGVITRWSFQAHALSVPQLSFKVARPAGGNFFTVIGEGRVETPVPGMNTFPTLIPVQAGDIIGFSTHTDGFCSRPMAGYTYHVKAGYVGPSTTPVEFTGFADYQFAVSALLETDCDKDGLGDESQDTNLSTCAPGELPPPGTRSGNAPLATCKGLPATIVGTEGNDVRVASQARDVIAGLGGNDTLSGLAGNDLICGGPGKDTLKGGKDEDTLLGQTGKDTLTGGGAKDICKGGQGNDSAAKCEVEKSI